jgi:16S rRNA (cytosine967-C5)-methyltransferase
MKNCRAIAAQCLTGIINGASLNQKLPQYELKTAEKDRALLSQLCYGVLRNYPKLLGISQQLLRKPLKDKDTDILMLMLLGIYQLSETRIPDHAAVAETVAATRALKKPWAKGLINGVLRQWQRNNSSIIQQLSSAQAQAHPEWLHQALHQAWPDMADNIEQANNQQAPMCLRVNQQQLNRSDYIEQLNKQAIIAVPCRYSPHGLVLQQARDVFELPGFSDGLASVQDEAAQLSADLLQLKPGQRVLDACCAPGGKSCHILETEPALAELVALDIDSERLKKVEENLQRLELNASLVCGDATNRQQWWDGKLFDRILLDAPCSATGVIRRNPDIKVHRQPGDIKQLENLQQKILEDLWPTLLPGGLLLYATCSVLPQENEEAVARFCQQQCNAQHISIEADWGIDRPYGRQLFPQLTGHDGFFYALIHKSN